MLTATRQAMAPSIQYQPEYPTAANPTRTPAEVYTSVITCLPSATRARDRVLAPTRSNPNPRNRFTTMAPKRIHKPPVKAGSSRGCHS